MRSWREILTALTAPPRGFAADGRRLGLGLATAMERQRRDATHEVEDYLRDVPAEQVKAAA
ncbi:hypothetical protein [Actinophytocola xanthii]|uniref:Uncharacterized protein n=1 Tax=Actinophytocola xanthii TaxID=1912961 RepID=A0A1Q8CM33_9PSEU|nr:hypothetical protein [Actinophytocola xanthii]OLF15405.1 hypothetical protein BU204_21815 [Actinophytocola xanthii]